MATIAVIDIDPDTAALIGFMLHQQGHTVVEVSNLAAALQTVARERPALVLLAVASDEVQSLGLCRALRAIVAAPILLYNGRPNEDDEIRDYIYCGRSASAGLSPTPLGSPSCSNRVLQPIQLLIGWPLLRFGPGHHPPVCRTAVR